MSYPVLQDDAIQKIRRLEREQNAMHYYTEADIGTNIIYTEHITDGAVTGANIAADTITAGNIQAGAITASEIQAGVITGTHIAALTITASNIAGTTITAAKIATDTLTANEIAANAITTSEIAANTIQAGDIQANTITAGQIAASTITTTEIAANTILAGDIQASTITSTEIAANTIQASDIQALTITASEIAANTITGGKIAATTITAGNIVSGTITSTQIASTTILGSNIAGSTITGSNIAAATITASNIVANTITGNEIVGTTLSAISADLGAITAGTITGATFQTATSNPKVIMDSTGLRGITSTGGITFAIDAATGKITTIAGIGGGNLIKDSSFEKTTGAITDDWVSSSATISRSTTQKFHGAGSASIVSIGTGSTANGLVTLQSNGNRIPVTALVDYVASFWAYNTQTPRLGRIDFLWYNASNTNFQTDIGTLQSVTQNTWTRISQTFQAPATAVTVAIRFLSNRDGAAAGEQSYIDATQLEVGTFPTAYAPKPDEILPATVTTTEIADLTVVGGDLANTTITAGKLVANTLTANEINTNAITSDEIAATTIVAGDIATGTITGTQIAATTIAASHIVSNTITATQIAANTITASQIAANTITGTEIIGTTLSAITADLGDIIAGTVTGATIRTAASGTRLEMNSTSFKGYGLITPPTMTSASITTVAGPPAGAQWYKVTALNAAGETIGSNQLTVTTATTADSPRVEWQTVLGATKYRVYHGTTSNGQNKYLERTVDANNNDSGGIFTFGGDGLLVLIHSAANNALFVAGTVPGSNTALLEKFSLDNSANLTLLSGQITGANIKTDATGDRLELSSAGLISKERLDDPDFAPSISITTVAAGVGLAPATYRYRIYAIDEGSRSTLPSLHTDIVITANTQAPILSWTRITGATGYVVNRSTDGGSTWRAWILGNVTKWTNVAADGTGSANVLPTTNTTDATTFSLTSLAGLQVFDGHDTGAAAISVSPTTGLSLWAPELDNDQVVMNFIRNANKLKFISAADEPIGEIYGYLRHPGDDPGVAAMEFINHAPVGDYMADIWLGAEAPGVGGAAAYFNMQAYNNGRTALDSTAGGTDGATEIFARYGSASALDRYVRVRTEHNSGSTTIYDKYLIRGDGYSDYSFKPITVELTGASSHTFTGLDATAHGGYVITIIGRLINTSGGDRLVVARPNGNTYSGRSITHRGYWDTAAASSNSQHLLLAGYGYHLCQTNFALGGHISARAVIQGKRDNANSGRVCQSTYSYSEGNRIMASNSSSYLDETPLGAAPANWTSLLIDFSNQGAGQTFTGRISIARWDSAVL